MLIKGESLTKEKKEDMEKTLTGIVESYVKFKEFPRDEVAQALKSLIDRLTEVYGVLLVTLWKGSIIIILDCPTLESLELLWSDYDSGHLGKVVEQYLATDEIKKKFNLETICLKTIIEKESYLKCMEALKKRLTTSSGEYKQNI